MRYLRAVESFSGRDLRRPAQDQTYDVIAGDVLRDDDWVCVGYPSMFAELAGNLSRDVRGSIDALTATREELGTLAERHGDDVDGWPAGVRDRFERQQTHAAQIRTEIRDQVRSRDDQVNALRTKALDDRNTEHGSDRGLSAANHRTDGTQSLRDSVMRILDLRVRSGVLPAHSAERVDHLMGEGNQETQTRAQRWAAAAGDPNYESAFLKLLTDPQRGHLLWTAEEQEAYRTVAAVRTAMSLGADHGAEMVPLTLDPAILLTSDGSTNPLRRISRVVRTVSNTWQGVTSAGASAEWKSEGAEAADGSPDLADVSIPVHLADVDVLYSYEVGMDAVNFLGELQRVMIDSADQLQASAFATGSGSGQPRGVVTALAGSASEINSASAEAFTAADVYALQNALPARFSARAQWCAHIAIINAAAQFETGNGAKAFPEIADDRLLRKPLNELSNMDGVIVPAATASNFVLLYGDFSNFVIVDRVGATLEILPGYGANRRPTAQRHAFLTFRTGSDVVVKQGLRLLDVPTVA